MDAFQARLDALQKESKDQITQVMAALVAAVGESGVDGVSPSRVALALAQRFTDERVDVSFPVLCFIDAMLVRGKQGGGAEVAAVQAVLGALWKLVTSGTLFASYATAAAPAVREKAIRMVRRWKQRNQLATNISDALLDMMERAPATSTPAVASSTETPAESSSAQPTNAGGEDSRGLSRRDVQTFHALLQAFANVLEELPPERRGAYASMVQQEHFVGPTASAFAFMKDLYVAVRNECLERAKHPVGDAESAVASSSAEDGANDGRQALGRLLDQLNARSSDPSTTTAGGTSADGAAAANTLPVVRYTTPLYSDSHQLRTLVQRSGFGELRRRRVTASSADATLSGLGPSIYYPQKEATTMRPFRIPAAKQANGGAVRTWFPPLHQWVGQKDMATLALFEGRGTSQTDRSTSHVLSVAKKRARDPSDAA